MSSIVSCGGIIVPLLTTSTVLTFDEVFDEGVQVLVEECFSTKQPEYLNCVYCVKEFVHVAQEVFNGIVNRVLEVRHHEDAVLAPKIAALCYGHLNVIEIQPPTLFGKLRSRITCMRGRARP